MREGLGWLWLISLAVSSIAWLYLEILKARNQRFQTRRPLTGCELARQILDRHQFHRTSVIPVSGKGKGEADFLADQLVLEESVYYGNRLADLAEALYETAGHREALRSALPGGLRRTGGRIFGLEVLLSWVLILGGILWGRSGGLIAAGQFFFVLAFFFALSSLGKEWEIAEQAISEMGGMEWGTDERIRMKRLLKARRWAPLAGVFKAPQVIFSFLWPVKT